MDRGYLVPAGEEGSLPFPTTIEQLKAGGYVFQEHKPCSGKTCTAQIEFWKTPKGKFMPFDVDVAGNVVAHWANCPDSASFRNRIGA